MKITWSKTSIATVVLIVITIGLFYWGTLNFNKIEPEKLAVFVKENKLYLKDVQNKNDKAIVLADMLFAKVTDQSVMTAMSDQYIREHVKFTSDYKTLFFVAPINTTTNNGTLMRATLSQSNDHISISKIKKVAEEVRQFDIAADGHLLVYEQGTSDENAVLLGETEEIGFDISKNVQNFKLSQDGKTIVYTAYSATTKDSESPRYSLYKRDLSSFNESKLVDDELFEWIDANDDLSKVYYTKVNETAGPFDVLCLDEKNQVSTIVKNVRQVHSKVNDGQFYFQRDTVTEVPLADFVEDDVPDDATKDSLRAQLLADFTVDLKSTLLYFDGKKEQTVTDELDAVQYVNVKQQVAVFSKIKQKKRQQLNLSDVSTIEQVRTVADLTDQIDTHIYVATNITQQHRVNNDAEYALDDVQVRDSNLYLLMANPDTAQQNLVSIAITKFDITGHKQVAKNVSRFFVGEQSNTLYYYQNEKNEHAKLYQLTDKKRKVDGSVTSYVNVLDL